MKNLSLPAIIILSSLSLCVNAKPSPPVSVLSVKSDIFYFKVAKSFIGATVEVYAADGKLVLTDTVKHHKTIIDFDQEKVGNYTIVIKKDADKMDFVYEKADRWLGHENVDPSITIVQ